MKAAHQMLEFSHSRRTRRDAQRTDSTGSSREGAAERPQGLLLGPLGTSGPKVTPGT